MHTLRSGYTQIELIFIMVIIGILASIAIPKLMQLRDDSLLAKDISNMALCLQDSAAQYTASGNIGASDACDQIVCYSITDNDPENFVVVTDQAADTFCSRVNEIGSHLADTYSFKGASVSI